MSRSPVLRTDQVQGFHLHPSHMSAGRGRLLSHVLHRSSRGRTLRRVPGAIFKAAEALNKIFKQCLTLQITLPRSPTSLPFPCVDARPFQCLPIYARVNRAIFAFNDKSHATQASPGTTDAG